MNFEEQSTRPHQLPQSATTGFPSLATTPQPRTLSIKSTQISSSAGRECNMTRTCLPCTFKSSHDTSDVLLTYIKQNVWPRPQHSSLLQMRCSPRRLPPRTHHLRPLLPPLGRQSHLRTALILHVRKPRHRRLRHHPRSILRVRVQRHGNR